MTDRKPTSEDILDNATAAIRTDTMDAEEIRAATERVWANITADVAEAHAPLRSCDDFQALLPDYVAGRLPEARALLVGDHTRECLTCRRALIAARKGDQQVETAARSGSRKRIPARYRWAAAAVVLLAVGAVGYRVASNTIADLALRTSITAVDGSVHLVAEDGTQALATGDVVRARQQVRTAKGSSAVLRLADGSTIEMDERSQISMRAGRGGTTVDLARGNIIVHAADQGRGRLAVATIDCQVAVKGTIFAVNHGLKGSRVSVIEGEVVVEHGSARDLLHPGDQVTTDKRLRPVPLEAEIAWSRNAEEHLALLRELRELHRDLDQHVDLPDARYSTRLLDLAPADTIVYAAIPNLTVGLGAARQVIDGHLESSPILGAWWDEHVVAQGLDAVIDGILDRLQGLGDAVGEEIVVALPQAAIEQQGGPVVLAVLDDPGTFRILLAAEVARLNALAGGDVPLVVVSDPWQAQGEGPQWLLWVHEDVFAATMSAEQLQQLATVLAGGDAPSFADTELHTRLAAVYAEGVEWLFGLDLRTMLATAAAHDGDELEILERTGLLDASTLIIERSSSGERATTQGVLDFDGPRQGVASWLAPPAPMGSLDFVSPSALMAASVVAKDAADMFDDLFDLLASADPGFVDELLAFQHEHGVSVRDDLMAPLGGEAAVAVDGPLLPTPAWKLVVEVYDPAALEHAIEWAVDEVNRACADEGDPGLQLEEVVVGGRTYHAITHLGTGTTVHYVVADGYLVAAPRRSLLDHALQLRAAGTGLPRSPQFRALLPANGYTDCSALMYRDLSALTDVVAGSAMSSLDKEAVAVLSELSAASLFCVYGEESRIVVSGSGGSLLASVLGLPAVFGGMGMPGVPAEPPTTATDELSS